MLKPKYRIFHDTELMGYFPEMKYLIFWYPAKRDENGYASGFDSLEDAENYFKAFDINDYKIVER